MIRDIGLDREVSSKLILFYSGVCLAVHPYSARERSTHVASIYDPIVITLFLGCCGVRVAKIATSNKECLSLIDTSGTCKAI